MEPNEDATPPVEFVAEIVSAGECLVTPCESKAEQRIDDESKE